MLRVLNESLILVGTHLRRTGASGQMITCGQSADTSAKHYHSPAHRKAWGKVEISRENGRHPCFTIAENPTGPIPHLWALTDLL